MCNKLKKLLLFSMILYSWQSQSIIVGSNNVVSVENPVLFPASGNATNEMRGFAEFINGFTLNDSLTRCLFNSFFPVSGLIDMRGGQLNLANDIILSNTASFLTTGTITGNNFSVHFPIDFNPFSLPITTTSGTFVFEKQKLIFNSNVSLKASILFNSICEIEGNGYTFDLTNITNFTIGIGANVLLKNMIVRGISGTKIKFSDTTGVLRLQDITWIQSGDYTFTNGAFTIDGDVLFTGTSNFIYSSSQTSTINANATLMFDNGMTFSYAPPTNSRNLINMIDQTSNFYLLNTSLISTSTGLQLTKGSLYIDGLCNVLSNATVLAQGITFGDGVTANNNLTIKVLAESGFNVSSGFLVYNNV